ncbi:D-glycerate dehydrogenase [Paenibacillus sp. 598K]|uniref:2-hydroxyacid dehydrogenase n=1 Tax=Paenibacillus sp. 598K TaxID=1117987 RepID=UPI000FF909FD|nr:D-glycerate dehydrogenase [Paenibacillus sp. 598K]GBF75213.1 D-glycerate dehydrogenase [Paenibacillus sp. 598K]
MSDKPKVLVTRQLPERVMAYLAEHAEVTCHEEDRGLSREELLAGIRGKDAVLCLLTDRIDAEVMDAEPGLQVIANYAVGYNNIDIEAATARGIVVTNTPDVLTAATADIAWALLMAVSRRLVEGDALVRSGGWKGWAPLQLIGGDVTGATLGLIGLGRIGQAMMRRAQGFEMEIVYWNRTRLSKAEEAELGVRYASLDEVLQAADYLSLHVAYTPQTHHLIGERELRLMKPTAYLINTARGAHIDEAALVRALREGWIAGAGLDVYEREPALEDGLAALDNVVLAPHLGSATLQTRERMGMMAARGILAAHQGERPKHVVNTTLYER